MYQKKRTLNGRMSFWKIWVLKMSWLAIRRLVRIERYMSIARQLQSDGETSDAAYIAAGLKHDINDEREIMSFRVGVSRAWLYDNPDTATRNRMYLVKGDPVRINRRLGEDWAFIDYKMVNGSSLRKWIKISEIESITP